MARIGESRTPAEPSSKLQREKYARTLAAATELAGALPFDQVQMQDVAKGAGIAIGTLYRYFPSKTHLFVAVMATQIDGLRVVARRVADEGLESSEAVARTMTMALQALMRRPLLADAMIRSLNIAHVNKVMDVARIDSAFQDALWIAAGIDQPTESDEQLARLVNQQWFGMMQSCLNGHISVETGESDVRITCKLLLAGLSSSTEPRGAESETPLQGRVASAAFGGIRSKN